MVSWKDIDTKGKSSGTIKTTCPACSHERKKKTDPCLSVNLDKGAAKCWHCEEVFWRDPIQREKKQYNLPPPEWKNYTKLSDTAVNYLWEKRGIDQNTIKDCRITQEKVFMPAKGKPQNCIVFNYFEGAKLINKKYRSADKNFTQVKGAKKTFYGINDIAEASEIYIVEGEMDKLSFWQHGIKNCISVPNGANDLNDIFENCEEYLRDVDTFYIAVDMDSQGQKLEGELIKRLGKHKCKRVSFDGKDANDDLVSGKLEQSIKGARWYPVEGTFNAEDISDEIDYLYEHGHAAPIKPHDRYFKDLNTKFSILPGQLTTITGIPTHGKSNLIEWWVVNVVNDCDKKASFYSPEHLPMEQHHAQLSEKVIGKPFYNNTADSRRMNQMELREYKRWSKDKIYLTAPESGKIPDWNWLLERFTEQVFRYGIDLFVIDAFNKVRRKSPDSLGELNEVLARLTAFCKQHMVNIILIAHPRKMSKREDGSFEKPTLYDVKGSGDFYDQSDNGGCVYRYDGYTTLTSQKLKLKHQGNKGECEPLLFCHSNGRYFPEGTQPTYEPIFAIKQVQTTIVPDKSFEAEKQPPIDADEDNTDWDSLEKSFT